MVVLFGGAVFTSRGRTVSLALRVVVATVAGVAITLFDFPFVSLLTIVGLDWAPRAVMLLALTLIFQTCSNNDSNKLALGCGI